MDYITLMQTHQGKRYMLTVVETTPGMLDTYPAPDATAQITILGLVLWHYGTPEQYKLGNRTHFRADTWPESTGLSGAPYSQSRASLWEN